VLTPEEIGALRSGQLMAMTTDQVASLSTDQILAISTAQMRALKVGQIQALSAVQIAALPDNDIAAMLATQVCALSTTQHAALTATQLGVLPVGSPLVLDLNGDGINTLSIAQGVSFDLFADGAAVHTGWVGSGDGLLALDRNHDGVIDDGGELFGTATTLADGTRAADGFSALAELDTNGDGRIDAADAAFGDLRVWVDANADGVSQPGELQTLSSLGIAALGVGAAPANITNQGNWIGLAGSYQTTSGAVMGMSDVWFVANRNENATLSDQVSQLTQAIGAYGTAAASASGGLTALSDPAPAAAATGALATNVAGLARELGQFGGIGNDGQQLAGSAAPTLGRQLLDSAAPLLAAPKA
jgi:hypothetical protein